MVSDTARRAMRYLFYVCIVMCIVSFVLQLSIGEYFWALVSALLVVLKYFNLKAWELRTKLFREELQREIDEAIRQQRIDALYGNTRKSAESNQEVSE